jgi:hypothetical protein
MAVNGVFNFLTSADNKAGDSSPEQGSTYFAEGTELIFHLEDDSDPTNGEDYYDRWYYTPGLANGGSVYRIDETNLQIVSTDPYTYRVVSQGDFVSNIYWAEGSTANYWDIGTLSIVPRIDDVGLDQYLIWGGTEMAKMTDGTTEIDTQDEQTADVTFTTDSNTLKVLLEVDTISLAYGVGQYTISKDGEFQRRPTVIIFSTNCTSISVSDLIADKWNLISKPELTGDVAFYKVIDPERDSDYAGLIPSQGDYATATIEIPIETAAATGSAGHDIAIWMNDLQLLSNVAVGAPSVSIPTAYGVQGYGLAATINDETFTVSSNAPATMVLYGDFTLPA